MKSGSRLQLNPSKLKKFITVGWWALSHESHIANDIKISHFIRKHYRKIQQLFLMKEIPQRSLPPTEHSHEKTTPHFFSLSFFSSNPSFPIKKGKLRADNSGKARLFDPHAVLSSFFAIQFKWVGISGVYRLFAQKDKSPFANCSHIKMKRDIPNRTERGRGKKIDSE